MKKKFRFHISSSTLPYLEGWGSILLNILLFGAKYAVGVASGSVAIIADAWHTLSDSISSLLVIVGVKWSRKPPDSGHPYGHGRADALASLVIGILLVMVAIFFGRDSIGKLLEHQRAHYGWGALVVTALSILTKELMARFSIWAGKKSGCATLKADGWHHRSDALSSVAILLGIIAGHVYPSAWWIDGVLGLLVSLFILKAAIDILKSVISPLLGEAPSPELIAQVRRICRREYGSSCHPHHFHIHQYGKHTELTFHIRLPASTSLGEAHNMANRLESQLRTELDIFATIHLEPLKDSDNPGS